MKYTEEQTQEILESYNNNPTYEQVLLLAEKFEVSPRSIIAKLSKLGVYRKKEKVTKNGQEIVKKEDLVIRIQNELERVAGTEIYVPTMAKTSKQELWAILNILEGL